MPEANCDILREELQEIKTLKLEFDAALSESVKTGEVATPTELKRQIEQKTGTLREKLWPFEKLSRLELHQQYETQVQALATAKVIEVQPDGSSLVKGIDGRDYLLPGFEAVVTTLRESPERLRRKIEQGFSKIMLVPFGQSLDELSQRYSEVILRHHREGKLLATKRDQNEPNQVLELDENQPLWRWDQYNDADRNGKLLYYPKEFSRSHGGVSKSDLLTQDQTSKTPGWHVVLMEDLPNIPRQGRGQTVGDRPQLEANKTPKEYLKALLENPSYTEEVGMTPEDWLIYAITYLETTNQVVDDFRGNGSIAYLPGAYFAAAEFVPGGCWDRDYPQASLRRNVPDYRDGRIGARSAVRVT